MAWKFLRTNEIKSINHLKTTDHIAEASVIIHAPLEKVWRALMDPVASKQFMFGAVVKSTWREGDAITWSGEWKGKPFEDRGVVLKVEPPSLLQYSHFSPLSGKSDTPANYHIITITLSEEDDGVFLSLTQDKNETAEAKEHSEKNWKTMLENLKNFLE